VQIDPDSAGSEIAGADALPLTQVADAVEHLVEKGAIQIQADDAVDAELMLLATAFAASALFEPVPGGAPWSAVPGLRLTNYTPDGRMRLKPGLTSALTLTLNGSALPWAASAPLRLPVSSVSIWDLPGSSVLSLKFMVSGQWPADVVRPCVQARIGAGPVSTLPLGEDQLTLRLLPPAAGGHEYSWRITGSRPDGTPLAGPWQTSEDIFLIVAPAELPPDTDLPT
jgi:hypothetical protein